jgi:thiol:disulfide interchange protein DsbD
MSMMDKSLAVSRALARAWLLVALAAAAVLAAAQPAVQPPSLRLKLDAWQGAALTGELAVTFPPGLHAYQNPPTEDWMIPITVTADTAGVRLERVRYPKGELKLVGGGEAPAAVHSGTIRIPLRFLATGAARPEALAVRFRFQQCDATTCFPPRTLRAEARVARAAAAEPAAPGAAVPEGPDAPAAAVEATGAVAPDAPPPPAPVAAEGGLGGFLREAFTQGNYAAIVLGAILVGLLLCLTPCVYPVIPITVSYFSNQGAGSLAGRLGLGFLYMTGIAITYGVVGGVAAALGGSVGELFTKPWFMFSLAALMVGLGLSMFGLYEIGIPKAIGRHIKGRQGPVGALVMGLLVGAAAAPCAGAFVSGLAIEVARIGLVPLGILVFTAIGVGIGLPFVALGAASSGIRSLPKSGSWLDTVKAVLGVAVMYLAFDYLLQGLGFRSDEPRTAFAWAAFFGLAALFLLAFRNKGVSTVTLGVKGVAVLALGFFAGSAYTTGQALTIEAEFAEMGVARRIAWQKFTPEAFAAAKASGKPILVDVTADWCARCREIDRDIFQTARAVRATQNVVALKIDHSTGVDPAYIEATTRQFGVTGLPHIEYLRPGGERSEVVFDVRSIDEFEASLRRAGATW